MSLRPCEKVAGNVDGVGLRHVVYDLLIDKYLYESSCIALAISEEYDGFSSQYTMSRERKGLVVNNRSFFFTPTSWNQFIDQYISLDSIKLCNLNHLYWLPANLLVSTILQMPNLEDLSIKGTQVCTFCHVARILKACLKVLKLDFSYTEQKVDDIWSGLLKEEGFSPDDLFAGFRKLTRLKMSTVARDAKNDIVNDPWFLIINILSWCRDCKELSVEITYAGAFERDWLAPFGEDSKLKHRDVQYAMWEDLFPKLQWIYSLTSLVLIKMNDRHIISRLLDDLWSCFFPSHMIENASENRLPLRCLWIQDFEIDPRDAWHFLIPECLRSFNSGELVDEEMYKTEFPNLENWNAMDLTTPSESLPPKPKLKFYCGIFDDESYYKFCQAHPNLEHLRIESGGGDLLPPFASVAVCKLQKLESFNCGRHYISKEFVEGMAEAYPILKILRLTTYLATLPADGKAVFSAFRFPHLTTLSLCNLQLLDGSALISIINGCPKLEIVHLETDTLDSSSFASNLEQSLRLATKLRDFRLRWNHKEDVYPETAFSILKAILKESIKKSMEETKLERLTLIDAGTAAVDLPDWKHPPEFADFLVRFTAQMTHLTCCCLTFKQMDIDLMKAIKERVEEQVVMERPSLWFHLGRDLPDASDPGVPSIHYHQMVNPIVFTTPPFYTV